MSMESDTDRQAMEEEHPYLRPPEDAPEANDYDLSGMAPTEEPGEEEDPEPTAMTAFIVLIDNEGMAVATNDLSALESDDLVLRRRADMPDIYRACTEIAKDVMVLQQAQNTAYAINSLAQQQMEQSQQQKMAQALANKGIRVPGQ